MAIDNNYSAREVGQCIEHMSGAAACGKSFLLIRLTSLEKRQSARWRSDRVSRKANLHPLTSFSRSLRTHTPCIFLSHSYYYHRRHRITVEALSVAVYMYYAPTYMQRACECNSIVILQRKPNVMTRGDDDAMRRPAPIVATLFTIARLIVSSASAHRVQPLTFVLCLFAFHVVLIAF
jgi:hypothetical protein